MATNNALRFALWFAVSLVLLLPAALAQTGGNLETVLTKMDDNAKAFRSAQANFTAKMWNSVINSFVPPDDVGKIYIRKTGSAMQASAVYTQPPNKQIVFSGNKLQIYQNGQVNEYDASAHRDELESFLVLGFGSSGQEMRNSYDVRDLGRQNVGNTPTEELELVPKSASVLAHVPKILLWIDPNMGVARQQQVFVEKDGDYRLAEYTNIKLNQNVPGSAFKLKPGTKTVSH